MAVKIGNLDISAFKLGSADTKVYLGDTLLYPTAPPSFQGKWLATYNGGTTSSAECDASSAITYNEITLTNLESVEIGDCVTSIGEEAFLECSSLTSCTIGSGVTSIGNSAFEECSNLTSIDIPDSVTSIGNYTFYNCTSLTSIDIPSGVTSIGESAFRNCSNLTSITVNATTPPSLGFIAFGASTCPIYVPSQSVNAYKSASGWSTYASRIHAIPIIPTAYTQVEYISSENISTAVTGPYIDTNFTPNQNTRVLIDYQATVINQNNRRIFGSGRFNDTSAGNLIWSMEGTLGRSNCRFYYKFDSAAGWNRTSIVPDTNRHVVDFNREGKIWLDDTAVVTLPNNTFNCKYHLGVFNEIGTGIQEHVNECLLGRVYSFKVYDNGTLVRDLVPCTNPSNVVGMYDIVNNVFYTTADNNYQFTAGNPI